MSLLKKVTTVKIPATKKFVAKDHFTTESKEVDFSYISADFKKYFLEKTETNIPATTYRISGLIQPSSSTYIVSKLGVATETTLWGLWNMLKKQNKDKQGALLINKYLNVFFIKNKSSEVGVAYAYFRGTGWYIEASSVSYPFIWDAGDQVVSREKLAGILK